MRNNGKSIRLRRLLAVLGHSLLETAACYPLLLLYMVYAMQAAPWWLLLLVWLLHAAGTLVGMRQANGHKASLLTLVVLAAALLPLVFAGAGLRAVILATLLLLLADIRGLIVGRKEQWRHLQLNLPLAGLAAALIVYGISSRVEAIEPHRTLLYLMSLLTLFGVLLRWNGDRVREASNAQETDQLLLRRIMSRNRRMTWMVVALILLLSMWNGLGQGLAYVRRWLAGLLRGLTSGEPPKPDSSPQEMPQQGPLDLPPPTPSPKWVHIVGQIVFVMLIVLISVALLLLMYRLLRRWLPERFRAFIERLARRLRLLREIRSIPMDQGDYVDEVERIERVGKRPGRLKKRRRDAAAVQDQDPRRAYEGLIRAAVKRGYKFRPSLTPTENGMELAGKEEFTGLQEQEIDLVVSRYNRIRYSSED
ncbi:hypothetical protein P9847_15600 [Paenibacillus chibensis]|uniref:DUF4129 domain-containing protein n=1 Tax=Paenibacillus chibensis TaxID=59846 RepID=A0ABU6PV19_9BACL|nr:hypothetical protein [Paenibacillus chibensis]